MKTVGFLDKHGHLPITTWHVTEFRIHEPLTELQQLRDEVNELRFKLHEIHARASGCEAGHESTSMLMHRFADEEQDRIIAQQLRFRAEEHSRAASVFEEIKQMSAYEPASYHGHL